MSTAPNDMILVATQLTELPFFSPHLTLRLMDVTPEMARTLLVRENCNRNHRLATVRTYAEAMKDGAWDLNGDTIRFDSQGVLRDGGQRLRAISQAETTVRMLLIFGLEPKTVKTMDRGRGRTVANNLQINKTCTRASNTAAALRILHNYLRHGRLVVDGMGSCFEVRHAENLLQKYPTSHDCVVQSEDHRGPFRWVGMAAVHLFLFRQVDRALADEFMLRLADGSILKGNPILALREKLITMNTQDCKKGHEVIAAALLRRTWKAYRKYRAFQEMGTPKDVSVNLGKIHDGETSDPYIDGLNKGPENWK